MMQLSLIDIRFLELEDLMRIQKDICNTEQKL